MSSRTTTRCRHVKINGARCTMPSWKDNGLCFEHNYRWEQQLRRPAPTRQTFSPGIPFVWVEDEASVLHNLNLIAKALGDSEIDHRQAAVMTCVQRTCLRTLRQREERLQSEEESEPIVADCVEEDGGQLLVPQEIPARPATPAAPTEPAPELVLEESAPESFAESAPAVESAPEPALDAPPATEPAATPTIAPDPSLPPPDSSEPEGSNLLTLNAVAEIPAFALAFLNRNPCPVTPVSCPVTPVVSTPTQNPQLTPLLSTPTHSREKIAGASSLSPAVGD